MEAQVFKGRLIGTYIVAASELDGFGWNDERGEVIDQKPGSITAHMSSVEWDQVHHEEAVPEPLRTLMAERGFTFTEGGLA
jgi:hypothetical protein